MKVAQSRYLWMYIALTQPALLILHYITYLFVELLQVKFNKKKITLFRSTMWLEKVVQIIGRYACMELKRKSAKAKVADFFLSPKESKFFIKTARMVIRTLQHAWERGCSPESGSV